MVVMNRVVALSDKAHRMINTDDFRRIMEETEGGLLAYAPAKLNITLRIGATERETGLHKISSVMQAVGSIGLCDEIVLRKFSIREGSEEKAEGHSIIKDNIMERALRELSSEARQKLPCRITLYEKNIPIAAGLGGGSSDAAAVLRLANRAFGLRMTTMQLDTVAQRVGNDVAFLLRGGRALVEGAKAHTITPMGSRDLYYLIVRPDVLLNTERMYGLFDQRREMLSDLGYENDFTRLAFEISPETEKVLSLIRYLGGAVENGITGKGPTVFAGYNTIDECEDARAELFRGVGYHRGAGTGMNVYIARSVGPFID